jgi:penicillin-binding protein 1A
MRNARATSAMPADAASAIEQAGDGKVDAIAAALKEAAERNPIGQASPPDERDPPPVLPAPSVEPAAAPPSSPPLPPRTFFPPRRRPSVVELLRAHPRLTLGAYANRFGRRLRRTGATINENATKGLRQARLGVRQGAGAAASFLAASRGRLGARMAALFPRRSRKPASSPASPAPRSRRRPRWTHAALVVMIGLTLVFGYLAHSLFTLPVNGGLIVEATPSALVLEADSGSVFATRGVFKGDKLAPNDLPPDLARAVVAIEDRRFYDHHGVDVRGTARALWRNAQAGGTREGGSTITQQLARLLFLSQDRTLRRKVQEAMLAFWLESQLSKEEILVRYLNTAYFGAGAYGVDAAAKRYFGKKAKELSLSEAAMLAGLVRAPSQLAPTRNLEGARERAETVLQAMVETGAITPEQANAARAQPANLRLPPETPPGTNYFVDLVSQDVKRLLGHAPADLTLRTTLDLDLQKLAEDAVTRRLDAEGTAKNVSQGALVAMTYDGAIVALVGGRDYEQSQFNRATQARRQPGSLFKLFVYQAAFQRGLTPQTTMVDQPTQIGDWEPQNASGRFRGPVTLRAAFANSINTIAVQLAEEVGLKSVIEVAKRMGVQSELPAVPSLALGSAEVTLMEMTRAFGAVAANVQTLEPYAVRAIRGTQQDLYTRPATQPAAPDGGPARAAMLDVLAAVVREGTGKAARLPNIPVAGKTGTTQDYRDAWFIGFTSDLIVGVWVGNDDNSSMKNVAGGGMPAAIWKDFVARASATLAKKKPPQAAAAPALARTTGTVPPTAEAVLRGTPDVVDTGTLEIRDKTVRLVGIEGERGRAARELARFLRRREVTCEPTADSSEAYRCRVEGQDLSETILLAGGARATPDAPPELLAAEEAARSARAGLWRRWR